MIENYHKFNHLDIIERARKNFDGNKFMKEIESSLT
jgi:hypothetical protein